MRKHNRTPKKLHKGQGKDNDYRDQLSRVYDAFFDTPMTMKEADKFCGIMRENICRYVKALREAGRIALRKKRFCKVTRHWAGEYTTNPIMFPIDQQLEIPYDYSTIQ